LIKILKTEGAHLNHIRPEYLLSHRDLAQFLSDAPAESSQCWHSSLKKITPGTFTYISVECWITLVYQVFRIYLLSRVNLKTLRVALPGVADPSALDSSNFISQPEAILLYWVEQASLGLF
jgi:hypothetical protein